MCCSENPKWITRIVISSYLFQRELLFQISFLCNDFCSPILSAIVFSTFTKLWIILKSYMCYRCLCGNVPVCVILYEDSDLASARSPVQGVLATLYRHEKGLSYKLEDHVFETWWGERHLSICLILPAALDHEVYSVSNRSEYQKLKIKAPRKQSGGRRIRRITFQPSVGQLHNLGSLTFHKPIEFHGLLRGWLYEET
jgi:hypothetical protein